MGRTVANVMFAGQVSSGSDSCEWRKSSRSYGEGACVEVGTPAPRRIDVRDSENPRGVVLWFAPAQWNVFVASVRSGAFGL
jgi:hypothetical protein